VLKRKEISPWHYNFTFECKNCSGGENYVLYQFCHSSVPPHQVVHERDLPPLAPSIHASCWTSDFVWWALLLGLCAIAFIICAILVAFVLVCILDWLEKKYDEDERVFWGFMIVLGLVFVFGYLCNLTAFIVANTMMPAGFGYSTAMRYLIVLLSIESLVFLPIILGSLGIAFTSLHEFFKTRRARAKQAVFPGKPEGKQESGALPTAAAKPTLWIHDCEVIEDNHSVAETIPEEFNNV